MKKYLSRKFGLVVGSVIIFTVLLTTGYIDANVYSQLVMFCLGGYMASNVTEGYLGKNKEDG